MDESAISVADLRIRSAALRRAIGWIGVGLPFVLPLGKVIFFDAGLPGSISAYYYTDMRNVFVAAICAIGVYLLFYPGYDRTDDLTASLAGAAAIVLALCPTTPPAPSEPTPAAHAAGLVHDISAGIFLLTLAYLAYFRFTKTAPVAKPAQAPTQTSTPEQRTSAKRPTKRKRQRNNWYHACGVIIAVCTVATVPADNLLPRASIDAWHPVFWLESVAVIAFGISWLIKGETFLKDLPHDNTAPSATSIGTDPPA